MVFSFRFKNLVSTTILHIAQFVPKNQRATTNRPSTFSVWDGGINSILFNFTRKKSSKKMAPLKPEKATEPYSDSDSSDSREEDEEGWDDVEQDEEETQQVISLLDDKVFPDVLSMLEHCKEKHSFDFLAVRQKLQLDFHGCVKLVNYSKSFSFLFCPNSTCTHMIRFSLRTRRAGAPLYFLVHCVLSWTWREKGNELKSKRNQT